MRQLLPVPSEDADVDALYVDVERPDAGATPWLAINMIESIDGSTNVGGDTKALGGPADKLVFHALRSRADVILVAAGTARADDYGPPKLSAERQQQRLDRGQAPRPRLAVVSGRLELDPSARLFSDPEQPPLLVTSAATLRTRGPDFDGVAEVWAVGDEQVHLPDVLARLRLDLGATFVLCEGGPSLNGALLDVGAIDEICLTTAPAVTGGDSRRIVHGAAPPHPSPFHFAHLLEEDGFLFARYLRSAT